MEILNTLAIIPARGGSKRIPHKNIRKFIDKPIIQFSIDTAYSSALFDEIMVSTDDIEIANLSEALGAKIPFYRSTKASSDKATLAEVIIDVIEAYEKKGISFKYICCILATAPFLTTSRLKEGFEKLIKDGFDSVVPFVQYPVPIQQAFKINQGTGKVEMFFDNQYGIRTQDFTPSFYDAGMFYWMKPESVREKKRISCNNTGAIVLSELEAHDIDNEDDWQMAEIKYLHFINNINNKNQ